MSGPGQSAARTAALAAPGVEVRRRPAGLYLASSRPYEQGDLIVTLDGVVTVAPGRHSLQVGAGRHLDAPPDAPLEPGADRFVWRATNHSCRPNARVTGHSIVSWQPVAANEEVTIHYEATEWELTSPFRCTCGSCDGREIRGFRYLSPLQRSELRELVAEHLRPLLPPS